MNVFVEHSLASGRGQAYSWASQCAWCVWKYDDWNDRYRKSIEDGLQGSGEVTKF